MGDPNDRHPKLVSQILHQFDDLRLDRDIKRGGGLIGDQYLGGADQRHRDHDALTHPTRELMRVILETFSWFWYTNHIQHFDRSVQCGFLRERTMHIQWFRDLPANR